MTDSRADAPGSRPRRLHDRIEDWLAGYPDTLPVRLVHRVPMRLWRLGLGRIEGDVVLTTTGRKSGLPRRIVPGPSRIDGRPSGDNHLRGTPRGQATRVLSRGAERTRSHQ